MSMKRSEATRTTTTYEVGILGKNNIITSVRSAKVPPTEAKMLEALIEFNFMKIDDFMANEVIVMEIVTNRRELSVFSKPLDAVRSRVIDRRNGVTVRPRGANAEVRPEEA